MDLVWLVCLRPMGCHLLNFFEISGRGFRSSAEKLRPRDNIGKLQRRPVFLSAFQAPVRRCAGKTSFFAPIYLTIMKISTTSVARSYHEEEQATHASMDDMAFCASTFTAITPDDSFWP